METFAKEAKAIVDFCRVGLVNPYFDRESLPWLPETLEEKGQ